VTEKPSIEKNLLKRYQKSYIAAGNNNTHTQEGQMDKYVCVVCSYVYDPEKGDPDSGVEPGTPFDKLPEDWLCPVCGAGKDQFEKQPA
jgi:rubredoxin